MEGVKGRRVVGSFRDGEFRNRLRVLLMGI